MQVKAVWQFFEAERDGNAIHLFAPGAPRRCTLSASAGSSATNGLCLSDYILDAEDGRRDHLAMFVVTAGRACASGRTISMAAGAGWRSASSMRRTSVMASVACSAARTEPATRPSI